jgi:phosphatidylglycerol lysyltransferase
LAASRDSAARQRARALVLERGWNASAYQILNPGLALWFSERGDAVAGYATFGHTWVVAGAPVCTEARLSAVIRELERDARSTGARIVYFAAGRRLATDLATDGAHHVLPIGAQPVWNPTRWPDVVRRKSSFRAQLNRARNKGVVVTEWRDAGNRHGELDDVRRAWLETRGLPPLHFMTESDTLGELHDRRVFVAERGRDGIAAFLVATPVPARRGWLIEQWPRRREAPNGTMQMLVDAAMRAVAADGAEYVTMGLAPLSERAGRLWEREPAWLRAAMRWMRAHGRRFYNFRGLEAFKASFEPARWEPLYVATVGSRITPWDLRAIAGVFGGGSPERLLARAIATAVLREGRNLSAVERITAP